MSTKPGRVLQPSADAAPFTPSEAVQRKVEEAERLEDHARVLERQAVAVGSWDEVVRLYREMDLRAVEAQHCRGDARILEERERAAHERHHLEPRAQPLAQETREAVRASLEEEIGFTFERVRMVEEADRRFGDLLAREDIDPDLRDQLDGVRARLRQTILGKKEPGTGGGKNY